MHLTSTDVSFTQGRTLWVFLQGMRANSHPCYRADHAPLLYVTLGSYNRVSTSPCRRLITSGIPYLIRQHHDSKCFLLFIGIVSLFIQMIESLALLKRFFSKLIRFFLKLRGWSVYNLPLIGYPGQESFSFLPRVYTFIYRLIYRLIWD